MPSTNSLVGETRDGDTAENLVAQTSALDIVKKGGVNGEAPTLYKQRSGNFIEDEGGIWGLEGDAAKCGCSDEAKAVCTVAAKEGDQKCGGGDNVGGGNFIEDAGGLWGIGVNGSKCGCSDIADAGDKRCGDGSDLAANASGGSCSRICGTCTDGSEKSQACSKSHEVALHQVHPATGVSPFALSEDGVRGKIFFASESGTTKRLAERLLKKFNDKSLPVDLVDPASYEPEDLPKEKLVIVVASTWEDGKAPKNAAFLAQWLEESSEDFRVGSGILRECRFCVFGVGSQAYGANFNAVARGDRKSVV